MKMFTEVADQKDTQIFWHSWIGNTSLLYIIVITHLDRISVQKQRLSAGQWVLWWKASAQWTVSFWVSVSKILPWFDTACWRYLGWAELDRQCNLWTCTASASQTVLRPGPWGASILQCRFSHWIQNVVRAAWPKTDVFQRNGILLLSEYVGKKQASISQVMILVPTIIYSHLLIFIRMGLAKATEWKNKGSKRGNDSMRGYVLEDILHRFHRLKAAAAPRPTKFHIHCTKTWIISPVLFWIHKPLEAQGSTTASHTLAPAAHPAKDTMCIC